MMVLIMTVISRKTSIVADRTSQIVKWNSAATRSLGPCGSPSARPPSPTNTRLSKAVTTINMQPRGLQRPLVELRVGMWLFGASGCEERSYLRLWHNHCRRLTRSYFEIVISREKKNEICSYCFWSSRDWYEYMNFIILRRRMQRGHVVAGVMYLHRIFST